jgi:outer membrane protein TolC
MIPWVLACVAAAAPATGAAAPAGAAEVPGGPGEPLRLSLAEVVERARASSASLARLRALQDGAEAELRAARAERRPVVDATAGYRRNSGVPELTLGLPPPGGTRTIFPDIRNEYSTRIGVSVPLYTGGRLGSLARAAEGERAAAGGDVAAGSADLSLEARVAYWDLATALESERVLGESLAAFDAHAADAVNRERHGLAARNEVLAVQVERDRAELARIEAGSLVAVLKADLARLLDLPPETRVEPADPLEAPPPAEEDAALLVAAALEARPERAALAARMEAAAARERAARADRLPQAWLSAGYDYARPNRKILPLEDGFADTWDATVTLSFNLLDGGRRAAAVDQRLSRTEALRRELEDLDRRIRFEVEQRLAEARAARAAVAVAERGLQSARESLRVASDRYRAGVILSSELLDAEAALLEAGLDRTEALARLRIMAARLDHAAGR